jgi:hypothetical protein
MSINAKNKEYGKNYLTTDASSNKTAVVYKY